MAAKKAKKKGIFDDYLMMFGTLASPKKTFEEEKKLSALEGLKYALLGCIPTIAIIFLMFIAMGVFNSTVLAASLLIIPIMIVIISLSWAFGGIFSWIIAKIFGLKNDLGNYLGVYGLFTGSSALIGTALWAIIMVPMLNILGLLLIIPASAYQSYMQYRMLRALELSQARSIGAVLTPVAISLVFAAMVIGLMIAIALLAGIASMPMAID